MAVEFICEVVGSEMMYRRKHKGMHYVLNGESKWRVWQGPALAVTDMGGLPNSLTVLRGESVTRDTKTAPNPSSVPCEVTK